MLIKTPYPVPRLRGGGNILANKQIIFDGQDIFIMKGAKCIFSVLYFEHDLILKARTLKSEFKVFCQCKFTFIQYR